MPYVTMRPIKIHGRSGTATEIASGQLLPADTPARVVSILQTQRAIAEAPAAAPTPAAPAVPAVPASTAAGTAAATVAADAGAGVGDDKAATAKR